MDYVEAAKKHKEATSDFINQSLQLLKEKPHEITTGCSDLGKLIKKRGNAVIWESYKLSAYVRLTPYPEMVLSGKCSPEHDTGQMIAEYLADRFRNFVVIIFTDTRCFFATKRDEIEDFPDIQEMGEQAVISEIRSFAKRSFSERLGKEYLKMDCNGLWEEFYETQYLSQRKNLKLFHRDIPKYMFKKAGMKIEESFYKKVTSKLRNNQTLDDYIEK